VTTADRLSRSVFSLLVEKGRLGPQTRFDAVDVSVSLLQQDQQAPVPAEDRRGLGLGALRELVEAASGYSGADRGATYP